MMNSIKLRKYREITVSLFLLLLLSVKGNAQGFLHAEGTKIVNEKGENVLLRGFGLGGWMLQEGYMLRVNREGQQHKIRARIEALTGPEKTQEFYDAWLANHTTKADIDSLKAWGFNSVRLPMHYNLYTLAADQEPVAGQHTWLDKGFAMTDSLLAWCKANQLYLILDLHAAPGGQGNDLNISDRDGSKPSLWENPADQQKTIALWKKIAERYKDEPSVAGYDVLNEPNWGFEDPANDKNGLKEKKNAPLKKLMQDITAAIREVDTKHIIIIEGNGWGNNYNGILPPWDKNMVLSFHKYWNYNDQQSIRHITDLRKQYNIPVWLGETGENSNVWFADAIRLLEQNNIGWAWWPLKKIGSNNPLEIRTNANYRQLVEYWSGKGAKPTAADAYKGLMELADAAKTANTIFHKDVIDAMMRQPFSAAAIPFKANIVTGNSTTLQAVDYDLGINRVAYYDTDTANYRVSDPKAVGGNSGRVYRNDGVDIHKEPTGSYYVTDITAGEWLQYTIDVKKKGTFTIQLQVAADNANSNLSLMIDGKPSGKTISIPATGGPEKWQTIEIRNVALKSGDQAIRIYTATGGFNLKEIRLILTDN